jgi:hypothetical protein
VSANLTSYNESVGNGTDYYQVQASNSAGVSSFTGGGPTTVNIAPPPPSTRGGGGCSLAPQSQSEGSSAGLWLPYAALVVGLSLRRARLHHDGASRTTGQKQRRPGLH